MMPIGPDQMGLTSCFQQHLVLLSSAWTRVFQHRSVAVKGDPNNCRNSPFIWIDTLSNCCCHMLTTGKKAPGSGEWWESLKQSTLLHCASTSSTFLHRFYYDVCSDPHVCQKIEQHPRLNICGPPLSHSLQIFTLVRKDPFDSSSCLMSHLSSVLSMLSTFLCLFFRYWNTNPNKKKCNNQKKVRETLGEAKVWLTF